MAREFGRHELARMISDEVRRAETKRQTTESDTISAKAAKFKDNRQKDFRKNNNKRKADNNAGKKCKHCKKGNHPEDECWQKHPEKSPWKDGPPKKMRINICRIN